MVDLAEELFGGVLDRMAVARLALIDDRGSPEVMPIVFARVGRRLFSPIDGKPKKSARLSRLAYIAQRPQVGLVLDHYASDWRALWWIKLTAQASSATASTPDWDAAVAALLSKYPQYQTTALFTGVPTMIAFEVSSVRWWAAQGEAEIRAWLLSEESSHCITSNPYNSLPPVG